MPEKKTIKNFTTADIEKYWNNKLSPSEMHEIEKAAMDDPFFADALEGYSNSKDPALEIATLKNRLDKKLKDETPVISLSTKKYYWLRIAAAVIVIAGSGLAVQQLFFTSKNETPVATVTKEEEQKDQAEKQEGVLNANTSGTASTNTVSGDIRKSKTVVDGVTSSVTNQAETPTSEIRPESNLANKEDITLSGREVTAANDAEKKSSIEEKKTEALNEVVVAPQANNNLAKEPQAKARAVTQNASNQGLMLANRFNYRVVDAQNNPVPFANVMNTRDNVGTYTDVKGFFNLVSSDSILDVQVRSLGFNSENYKLVPSNRANDLVLKEDATARNFMESNRSRQRVMSNAVRRDSADVVEPEVGWSNYNTYADNNIQIPEKVLSKKALTSQVELSFDVDKTGTPTNIAVIRSSQCKECDEEAIRLLKEGPKWKKKGKRSKTTITISVDQK